MLSRGSTTRLLITALLNVLDRCDEPLTMLRSARALMTEPGARLVRARTAAATLLLGRAVTPIRCACISALLHAWLLVHEIDVAVRACVEG